MKSTTGKVPANQGSSKKGADFSIAQNDKKASENMTSFSMKK